MAAALTLLAKQGGDVRFAQQMLFDTVTDASFDTDVQLAVDDERADGGEQADDRERAERDRD